jgi:pimeloyl-ACP methyl ester carboxylesterase
MPHLALIFWLALTLQPAAAQTPQPREAFANLPGVRLCYRDTGGDGIPVVLMHAATGSSRVWEHQIPAFTAAGFRVIAFDRRGYGKTAIAPGGVQPGSAADDLHALIDYLHIDRFHLVGTAAGGLAVIDYALSFPQRLRSVVLANTIGGVQDESYLVLGRRIRPPEFNGLPADVRELGPSYRAANPAGARRWMELERTSCAPGTPPAAQTMKHHLTFALVATIRTPTLLLTGDADLYAPPPVMKLFLERIKGAESVVVPEAGHSTYWEQPDAFNTAVLTFIRKH